MENIKNLNIYGMTESVIASGYPMTSGCPIDHDDIDPIVLEKGTKRMKNLGNAKAASGHDCALKGIVVQFDLKMTQTLHRQLLRYHFLDIISSQSLMHKGADGKHDFHKSVDPKMIERFKELLEEYKNNPTSENFERLSYSTPMGVEMWCRVTTNYLQLKTIYNQRRYHKLQEWKDICNWIETLPNFKEFALTPHVAQHG